MKSILFRDVERCYLCGKNFGNDPCDIHHVFEGRNRKNSEKYGLKIPLHHFECHIFGENSVHKNAEVAKTIKAEAQTKAMEYYGWSVEDFISIFGRNYL